MQNFEIHTLKNTLKCKDFTILSQFGVNGVKWNFTQKMFLNQLRCIHFKTICLNNNLCFFLIDQFCGWCGRDYKGVCFKSRRNILLSQVWIQHQNELGWLGVGLIAKDLCQVSWLDGKGTLMLGITLIVTMNI